jgi:hypothetical protein
MPCSFGLLPHPRSGTGTQPNGLLGLTVSVRWIPLVTAAYGTWVARPGNDKALVRGRTAPAHSWARLVLGHHRLVGKSPEGSRQIGYYALNLSRPRAA